MTKLTEAIKREITKDWATLFPSLGIYKPLWLLRRVGPLLEGICLNRDSSNERYQPIFHVHSLARADSSFSLTLADELRTVRNGTPEKIKATFHKDRYVDAANRINQQALLPLSGDLELSNVVKAYMNYMARPLAKYSVLLFEDIITTLLWCDRSGEAADKLAQFEKEMREWPPSVMSLRRVGGVNAWSEKCHSLMANPSAINEAVEHQIATHSLADLPHAKLLV